MTGFNLVSIHDVLAELGEDRTMEVLSSFACPLNEDVEYFLKRKAIEFAKQSFAQTHLVFASYKNDPVLVGYFALANKYIVVSPKKLNSRLKSRMRYFATYDSDLKCFNLAAPLIAQLGKNFNCGYNKLITGDELLKFACDKIKKTQLEIGGKFAYLECENKAKLLDFYSANGFCQFDKRMLESDEIGIQGEYLMQLIKYLK